EIGKLLLLLLFRSGSGSLGGLRLRHALLEFIHAPRGIYKLLLAGVKRMAHIANTHNNNRLRGTRFDHVATRATNLRLHVLGMYIYFHKRPEKIPLRARMTSLKFENLCDRSEFMPTTASRPPLPRPSAGNRGPETDMSIWCGRS